MAYTTNPNIPKVRAEAVRSYLDYYNGRRLHTGIRLLTPMQKIAEIIPSY